MRNNLPDLVLVWPMCLASWHLWPSLLAFFYFIYGESAAHCFGDAGLWKQSIMYDCHCIEKALRKLCSLLHHPFNDVEVYKEVGILLSDASAQCSSPSTAPSHNFQLHSALLVQSTFPALISSWCKGTSGRPIDCDEYWACGEREILLLSLEVNMTHGTKKSMQVLQRSHDLWEWKKDTNCLYTMRKKELQVIPRGY